VIGHVVFVIPIELGLKVFFGGTTLVVLWAVAEESLKFIFAYLFVLRNKAVNEPVDVVIYMITVALGFAALENTTTIPCALRLVRTLFGRQR